MTTTSGAPARAIRYLTVEPGRISLHGIALTDSEYAMLRGIAERMKRTPAAGSQADLPPVDHGIADKPEHGELKAALEPTC
jgi:hypothetical protein